MLTTNTYVFFLQLSFRVPTWAFKSRNVEEHQNIFSKCFSKVSKDEGVFNLLVICRNMTNTAHSGHIFASTRLAACSTIRAKDGWENANNFLGVKALMNGVSLNMWKKGSSHLSQGKQIPQ